ncbi:immunoglobulin domain protein [Trichinella nativa]|uniref:Immunoglobulin domain protein n=1 Tax=Trichinella nativa TaxID=6335 RepID=A0A1Y3EAZ5_9BILA|nr:immunoglobulin domain protein [Trichinella nativa]
MSFIAFLENLQMHGKHFILSLMSVMEIENRSCIIDSSGSSRNVSRSDGRVSGACSSFFSTSSSALSCLLDNALMNCRFFVIIMVSLAISAEAEGSQRFVEHPEETKVIIGQTAVLRCRIENQEGLVTWAKNGFILGTARSLPDFARYSMIGSDELGEYHLQIRNVTIQDDATYQCQATRLAAPTQVSLVARLAVLVPPSNAKLENIGSAITVSEGDERIVSCISEGGKPKPSVHWFIASNRNGMDVIRTWHYSEDTVMINEQMISTVRSQLKYVPKRTEDGHFLVCQVNHEALTTPLLTAVALTVLYAPKVTVSLNSTEPLTEGSSAVLFCQADAKPDQNLKYLWRQNSNVLHAANDPTLHIAELQYQHHRSVFTCEVSNSIGTGEGSYIVSLLYSPRLPKKDSTVLSVDSGQNVTLHCNIDANPPPMIKWFKIGSSEVIAEGINLNPFKEAVEGSTVEMVCVVSGYPLPDKIRWFKGKHPVDFDNHHNRFEKSKILNKGDGVFNILKIINVHGTDFDDFNCTAYNKHGIGSAVIKLLPSDPMPLYVMIPGVIGGCVAILVLACALFIVNRKYLCHSKLSRQGSGENGDLTVKVEALDALGRPYQYQPDICDPNDQADAVFNKDYVSIPQDNPDFDSLPPPYPSYYQDNVTFSNGNLRGSAINLTPRSNKGGNMVHMTYLGDRTPSSVHTSPDNLNGTSYLRSISPQLNASSGSSLPPYSVEMGINSLRPYGVYNMDAGSYFPNGILSVPLETVLEVSTPITGDEHSDSTVNILRCPSQNSTRV